MLESTAKFLIKNDFLRISEHIIKCNANYLLDVFWIDKNLSSIVWRDLVRFSLYMNFFHSKSCFSNLVCSNGVIDVVIKEKFWLCACFIDKNTVVYNYKRN